MKFKESDFVIYKDAQGAEVYTWIKFVVEAESLYFLDYEGTEATEAELSYYHAPNFNLPHQTDARIKQYHCETMIDRIVAVLQSAGLGHKFNVSKSAGKIILDIVIVDERVLLDPKNLENLVEKYNQVVKALQSRIPPGCGKNIPVALRYALGTIQLDSISY